MIDEQIGSYKIIKELGRGGMGVVYLGRHITEEWAKRRGDVAIKVLHAKLGTKAKYRDMLVHEAIKGDYATYHFLPKVFDLYEEAGQYYLIMEYIAGELLSERVRRGEFSFAEQLAFFKQLARHLDVLHGNGFVHRDLKPSNIKLHNNKVYLLDVGIAKVTGLDNYQDFIAGTPSYMAPEQFETSKVSTAVDRYAFGVLVYHLLTGQMPWDPSSTNDEIRQLKRSSRLQPISHYLPKVPLIIRQSIEKMLSANPAERFTTCAELVQNIEIGAGRSVLSTRKLTHAGRSCSMHLLVGSHESPAPRRPNSVPVTSFWIATKMVSEALFGEVMGKPYHPTKGEKNPQNHVSFYDAIVFCNRISQLVGRTPVYQIENQAALSLRGVQAEHAIVRWNRQANGFRLPTVAEWEYAARAGQNCTYAGSNDIHEVGWVLQQRCMPMGLKKPNAWGLYDMSGNLGEWCWDIALSFQRTPLQAQERAIRGGGWSQSARKAAVAYPASAAEHHKRDKGIRLVCNKSIGEA